MNDEHWEAIKKLLRAYERMRIENNLLCSILARAYFRQPVSQDWFAELRELRERPENQLSLDELEEKLAQADQERTEGKIQFLLESYLPPPDRIQ